MSVLVATVGQVHKLEAPRGAGVSGIRRVHPKVLSSGIEEFLCVNPFPSGCATVSITCGTPDELNVLLFFYFFRDLLLVSRAFLDLFDHSFQDFLYLLGRTLLWLDIPYRSQERQLLVKTPLRPVGTGFSPT